MKKVVHFILLGLCFIFFIVSPVTYAAEPSQSSSEQQPDIRVGIWTNQPNILLSADDNFSIVDSDTRAIIAKFKAKTKVNVSLKNNQIVMNGTALSAKKISVIVVQSDTERFIEVNMRYYRGSMEIFKTNGKPGLTIVNTLPLEQYLYGVIANEVPPDWPYEAVKAQTVASRTYALYNLKKHQEEGFDVCATTDCQVYGGRKSENVQTTNAVNDTYGQVVTYHDNVIAAFFHCNGGGYTENSENVWGTSLPYLRGVPDDSEGTPYYKWEKQLPPAEIAETLNNAGYKIGQLRSISLSVLKPGRPLLDTPPDRGVSGRIKSVLISGSTGSVELSGIKLRNLFNLNSTLFDIKIVVPVPQSLDVEITGTNGMTGTKNIPISLPPIQQNNSFLEKETIRRIIGRKDETISFTGYGWGHGVGLSQWGARKMAEKAAPQDTAYYKEILKHYYQSIDIKKYY